jgi:cytochrome c553
MIRRAFPSLIAVYLLSSGIAISAPPPVDQKEADLAIRAELEQRIAEIRNDPEAYRLAMREGRDRAATCTVCHGEDGNSIKEGTPSIAGQSPVYIVDQFQRYGDGRRYDPWMANLAKTISQEDKIKLALYLSVQRMVPTGSGNPELLELGKATYERLCVECHGNDGRGTEGYAKLAGQRPEYVIKMLNEFRTAGGNRFNPWMFARANMLGSQKEIEAVAAYLAQLE